MPNDHKDQTETADTADLFLPPFPDRDLHRDPCPGCEHVLGVHALELGCTYGWTYDVEGHALTDGCECDLTLATQWSPPIERDL